MESMNTKKYFTDGFFDELFEQDGFLREIAVQLFEKIEALADGELYNKQKAAELLLLNKGITFNVYNNAAGTEKILPFDIIPRIVNALEWERIEKGLKQRIKALNLFLQDIYTDQRIISDDVIVSEIIESAASFQPACKGLVPPKGIWCHISGTDLVRCGDNGEIYVLEDNLRCPSGVSYILSNRQIMKQMFPQLFDTCKVMPVQDYPEHLLRTLRHLAPDNSSIRWWLC